MAGTLFGVPKASVVTVDGKVLDLSVFAGHPLILAFCPSGACGAAGLLYDFSNLADRIAANDAWAIGITDDPLPPGADDLHLLLARDPDARLYAMLCDHLREQGADLSQGAVFLFGRGGNLQRYWAGQPDAKEVVEQLAQRR
jgi:peroxiredoxin